MTAIFEKRKPLVLTALFAFSAAGCSGVAADAPELDDPVAAPSSESDSSPTADSNNPDKAPLDVGPVPASPDVQKSPAEQMPRELIVKFKSETSAAVTKDLASALRERRALAHITADGSDSLDRFVGRHQVLDATRLLRNHEGLSLDQAKARIRSRPIVPTRLRAAQAQATSPSAQGTLSAFEGLVNVYRLRLAEGADLDAAIAELRDDPHVEYVHPNYVARLNYTPNDPYFASSGSYGQPRADLWNVKKVRAPLAWDSARGAGVVVAVLDTGVDINHPDLAGNVWTNPGEIANNGQDDDRNGHVDDINGWSVEQNNAMVADSAGHGTHVAGIIAAQDNNGTGIVGLAPDAKIMPVQVFGGSGGFVQSSDAFTLSQGLVYAAENGADVINNSWSLCQDGSCPSVPLVEEAVRAAHTGGAVVVFSSGNSNLDIRNFSPQNMPEVIVVGATTPSDTRADFSNFGLIDIGAPGTGDLNDPGVVAPKAGILSLRSTTCSSSDVCIDDYRVGQQYARLSGTSFAAPAVSGAAALVLALHPEYSQEQVRQVLRRRSTDVGASGYDTQFGHGRLDVGAISSEVAPLEALIQMPLTFTNNSISVGGKAHGSQFARYTLDYGPGANPTTWTSLYTSTTAQTSGLYFWKPTTLPDGDYTLRLRAYKTTGAVYEDRHLFSLDRISLNSPTPFAALPAGDITLEGSAGPGDFQSYALRVQKLETGASVNANIVLANNGLSPVLNGPLGVWKTQGLAAGHYKLFLDVKKASGTTTESAVVVVDPLVQPGSPFNIGDYSALTSKPSRALTVTDLQNDGRAEIVSGWADRVAVFSGNGQALPGWPRTVTNPENPYDTISDAPLVGDIDGDGSKDVVVSTLSGKVFAWSASGAPKPGWPRSLPSYTLALSLADVDRNSVLDVVIADASAGVHVLTGSGNALAGWPVNLPDAQGPATVADLNRDGKNEVVVSAGTAPNKLYVYSSSGVLQAGWPRDLVNTSFDLSGVQPVVGDMDDDGDLEIVAVGSDGANASASRVFVYHHNGQLLSSWSPNAPRVGPPVLGDVDGDGSLEVLASVIKADGTGSIHVWNRSGVALAGWPKSAPAAQGSWPLRFATPIVADIDGDARSEVIIARNGEFASSDVSMEFGFAVQVYRYDGALLTNLARPTFGSWSHVTWSPTLADIDGDQKLELLWLDAREWWRNNGEHMLSPRVYAWDLAAATNRAQSWTAERADARSSGMAQNVVPLVRLSQRNTTRRVTGLARFVVKAGASGVMQVKHPQGAVVQYAVGSNLLKYTTLAWGEQFNVPPNQDVKLRVVTSSAVDVTVDFW